MGHRATWVTESLKIWMQTLETVLCIFGMAVDFRNQGTEERHDISKRVQLAKQTTFNIHIEIFFYTVYTNFNDLLIRGILCM